MQEAFQLHLKLNNIPIQHLRLHFLSQAQGYGEKSDSRFSQALQTTKKKVKGNNDVPKQLNIQPEKIV